MQKNNKKKKSTMQKIIQIFVIFMLVLSFASVFITILQISF